MTNRNDEVLSHIRAEALRLAEMARADGMAQLAYILEAAAREAQEPTPDSGGQSVADPR